MSKPFMFHGLLVALVGLSMPFSVQASPPAMPEQWRDHVGEGFEQWEPSRAQLRTMQRYWQNIFQGTMYTYVESFLQADQNADDRVTLSELREAIVREAAHKNHADPESVRGQGDKGFMRSDLNQDGFYDRSELRAGCRARANQMLRYIASQLMQYDKNRDGKILKHEQPSRFERAMEEAKEKDANNDGRVTFEEYLGPRNPATTDDSWRKFREHRKKQWEERFVAIARQDPLTVRAYAKIREPSQAKPRDLVVDNNPPRYRHFREFVRYGLGGDIAKPIRERQRTKYH